MTFQAGAPLHTVLKDLLSFLEVYQSDPFSSEPLIEPKYERISIDLDPTVGFSAEIRPRVIWQEKDRDAASYTLRLDVDSDGNESFNRSVGRFVRRSDYDTG